MEPRIQYATTSDGVSIAYYAIGSGPPLVSTDLPTTHLLTEWRIPEERRTIEFAAQAFTFVRYDSRGFGLSDRNVTDFSLEALVADLEAVAGSLELGTFDLIARHMAVPIAVAYAVRHPTKISHLVLHQGSARGADLSNDLVEGLLGLADKDWELASESIVQAAMSWSQSEGTRRGGAWLRESVTAGTLISFMRQMKNWDVSGLLSQVTAPTLVIHPTKRRFLDIEMARRLTGGIPNARLMVVEGINTASPEALAAIGAFLTGRDVPAPPGPEPAHGTAVVLFADIAGSTALTERLGDAAFRAKARELDAALRALIRDHAGTPIEGKLLGDGVLAVFTSARQAIEAALACGIAGDEAGLPLHLGLHAGDVIREENNVYGGAVNIASRIAGLSAAGEVLVSETVRSLARTSAGVTFEDRGEQSLKGVGEGVRVWSVRAQAAI